MFIVNFHLTTLLKCQYPRFKLSLIANNVDYDISMCYETACELDSYKIIEKGSRD